MKESPTPLDRDPLRRHILNETVKIYQILRPASLLTWGVLLLSLAHESSGHLLARDCK